MEEPAKVDVMPNAASVGWVVDSRMNTQRYVSGFLTPANVAGFCFKRNVRTIARRVRALLLSSVMNRQVMGALI
eukprot:8941282-Lingulodinium_polyedra.AAC.1